MSTPSIATIVQMMEPLPEPLQARVVEHLREYLLDLEDELGWDGLYKKREPQLVAAARRARADRRREGIAAEPR